MHRNEFSDGKSALAYILAGNAYVTLVSKKTGIHFTYNVRQKKNKDGEESFAAPYFVRVLTGPDNNSNYTFLGTIFFTPSSEGRYSPGLKSSISPNAPSHAAWRWAWEHLRKGNVPTTLSIWHEGKCGRCGRRLTHQESILAGIGPECRKK